jgi:glycosyltransferase involved in cell wall biosynthesis
VAITGLAGGLEALGHSVHHVGPLPDRVDAFRRIRYNLTLARTGDAELADSDLIVGFDLDGFALRPRGSRYVVCLKGVMADELRFERSWPRLRFRLLSHLEGANARSADVVMVTSEYSRGIAIEAYGLDPARVRIVPEGIDLARWNAAAAATDEPATPGEPAATDNAATTDNAAAPGSAPDDGRSRPPSADAAGPVILSVARQYRRKNTSALLRAMPTILSAVPNTRLRIVGGGPELPRLEHERLALGLAGSVVITGEVPHTDAVRDEYRAADVFCLPSLQEGFGIAFLEAMASGLPIVACRIAAVPEVIPDGEAGLLVQPDDPKALARALIRLLKDPPLQRRMGEAGRRRARRHAWEEVARRFVAAAAS